MSSLWRSGVGRWLFRLKVGAVESARTLALPSTLEIGRCCRGRQSVYIYIFCTAGVGCGAATAVVPPLPRLGLSYGQNTDGGTPGPDFSLSHGSNIESNGLDISEQIDLSALENIRYLNRDIFSIEVPVSR